MTGRQNSFYFCSVLDTEVVVQLLRSAQADQVGDGRVFYHVYKTYRSSSVFNVLHIYGKMKIKNSLKVSFIIDKDGNVLLCV